jgi:hypothetical protein
VRTVSPYHVELSLMTYIFFRHNIKGCSEFS